MRDMTKTVTVNGEKLLYEISRDRKTGHWIGACHSLKVTACGKTEDGLQRHMCEVIEDLLRARAALHPDEGGGDEAT